MSAIREGNIGYGGLDEDYADTNKVLPSEEEIERRNSLRKREEEALKEQVEKLNESLNKGPSEPRNYPVNDIPFDGWIGVDLDGTLAVQTDNDMSIGEPVPEMAQRVRRWHAAKMKVKIFTARATNPAEIPKIKAWLLANKLPDLEITCTKDYAMIELWDDRAVEVIKNTGRPANLVRRMASPTGI